MRPRDLSDLETRGPGCIPNKTHLYNQTVVLEVRVQVTIYLGEEGHTETNKCMAAAL